MESRWLEGQAQGSSCLTGKCFITALGFVYIAHKKIVKTSHELSTEKFGKNFQSIYIHTHGNPN